MVRNARNARILLACALIALGATALALAQGQAPAAAPAPASATAGIHAKVDAIFAPWDSTSSPGCSVAISRDGVVDYARGYGMSNLEHDIAIAPDSIFHVASISKQFTAFSIALLAKEGKLSLDDAVRKYVPELPDYGAPITIRHLIHHTSGLRDQWSLLAMAGWRGDDLITEDDVLKVVARQKALNFAPGSEYLYSNTGFTLLAVIVKRVSGQSLRAFADVRIFKPLGMAATHFHDDHTEVVRRRTSAYQRRDEGGWSVSIPVFDTYGATSLFTTTGDLLKWEQNFVDARVGGRELIDEIQRTGKLNDGSDTGYGYGLSIGPYRGLRTVGHSGSDAGYRADVVRFPDQRLAIVALCNAGVISPTVLTRKVAEVYVGDQMTPAPAPPSGVKVPATELTGLAGVYWNEATGQALRVVMKDGQLGPANGPPLVPLGPGTFRLGETATEWRFTAPAAGAPRELRIVTPLVTPALLRRLDTATPSAAQLAAVAGDYKSDELFGVIYTVAVENGTLIVRRPKRQDEKLDAITADRFTGPSLGTVVFTHAASGPVDGVTFNSGRVRRIRFERMATVTATATADARRP